tara:strand:+ start:2745 stop:3383 length:639 start_codon:yes stop_codon:yes gene_type:complete
MILIINCTLGLEFAFFRNKKMIFQKKSKLSQNISEKLVVEIQSSFSKMGENYKSIKKIIIVTGPGSFTGIRSAITFAKIVNLYLNIKVIGISKFEILNLMSFKNDKKGLKNILIQNNQKTFFIQKFSSSGKARSAPELFNFEDRDLKINPETRTICDGLEFKKYLEVNKKIKTVKLIEFIDYKINDIYEIAKNLSEKNYVPKPLYTKNFFKT